jgi:hypothetical protein
LDSLKKMYYYYHSIDVSELTMHTCAYIAYSNSWIY